MQIFTPKNVLTVTHCDYEKDYSISIIRFIEEASDCEARKDEFVSLNLDANTGVLSITTDSTKLPNMNSPVTYYLFIDGEEDNTFTEVNNELTFSKQLDPLSPNGELAAHTVRLVVASDDKTKGCVFEFETSAISANDYEIVQGVNTYTLQFTNALNPYTTMDLTQLDITWGIRNGIVLVGETEPTITISTSSLFRLTGSSTLVLYVKFNDVTLYTEELALPESEIDLAIELENVLNNTTFYTNILVDVTAGSNTVYTYLYLNNNLILDTHIETIPHVGETVTAVLTLEENSVGNVFDETNTSTYFLHKSAVVSDVYELDMELAMNGFTGDSLVSSLNDNRSLPVIQYDTSYITFQDTHNYLQPIQFASIYEAMNIITVVSNLIGLDPLHIREGLIIDDVYFDEDNQVYVDGLRVYDSDLLLVPVEKSYLVNKRIEEENRVETIMINNVSDLATNYFTGDTSTYLDISDKYIGFNSDSSSVISKPFDTVTVLYGIQFELEYGNIASNIPVFIVIKIYNTNGSLHSTYGYEKIEEGQMKSTDGQANILVSSIPSGNLYINKSFANIYDIGRMDIQVSGGLSSQLTIRNLFIDVVVEGD